MHRTHSIAMVSGLVCWVGVGSVALGQETPEQETPERPPAELNPVLTDTSADRLLLERLSRPAGGVAVLPARGPAVGQVVPGQPADPSRLDLADGSTAWTEAGTIRPEGTYLVGWVGEVVRLRTGGLAFLPATEAGKPPEPAMALAPCGVYGRIGSVLGERQRGVWLSLTGEVLEYHGRNYLMPTVFASAEEPPEQPIEEPATDEGDATETDTQPVTPGNRIDELVGELEAERAERRGIDTAFEGVEGGEAAPGPRLDGRMLLSQRARMVRSAEGGWVIAVDNDRVKPELELPHRLRLLPCRVVEQMERQAENQGESWDFEVSGNLYRMGGVVYLLPRMFVTMAAEDVEPLQ